MMEGGRMEKGGASSSVQFGKAVEGSDRRGLSKEGVFVSKDGFHVHVEPGDGDSEHDEFAQASINPCTGEFEGNDGLQFDYYEFSEFNRLRALLFQVQRMKSEPVKCGDVEGSSRDTEELRYPDELLKRQFEAVYGSVNFEDPEMQKYLETMRETLKELRSMKPKDNEVLFQLLDVGINNVFAESSEKVLKSVITQEFPSWKQKMYASLSPCESNGEWFVLPRPDLKSIRAKYFPNFVDDADENESNLEEGNPAQLGHSKGETGSTLKISNKKDEDSKNSAKPLTNLHLYDPKFEFCFKMPYRIFSLDEYEDEPDEIPKMVSFRILEHLNMFPFGVTLSMFWETYYSTYGNVPRIQEIGSLDDLVLSHPEEIFVFNKDCDLPALIFPNFLEGIVSPDLIIKRLWHSVMCLLAKEPWIRADQVFDRINQQHGFEFKPLNWGFQNISGFLSYCAEKFGQEDTVTTYRLTTSENHIPCNIDFIMLNSESLKERVELAHGVVKAVKIRLRIPRNYMEPGESIDAYSNYMTTKTNYVMDLKSVIDPHRMFAVQRKWCARVATFQNRLQFHQSLKGAFNRGPPDPGDLKVRMYVLAFAAWAAGKPQWYRARIIQQRGSSYQVYSIDWGFQRTMTLENIRFMPRDLADQLAFAVPLRLKVANPFTRKRNPKWSDDARRVMYDVVDRHYLIDVLMLEEPKYNNVWGCLKWEVTCSVIKRLPKLMIYPSLTVEFYVKYKKLRSYKMQKRKAVKEAKTTEVGNLAEAKSSSVPSSIRNLDDLVKTSLHQEETKPSSVTNLENSV